MLQTKERTILSFIGVIMFLFSFWFTVVFKCGIYINISISMTILKIKCHTMNDLEWHKVVCHAIVSSTFHLSGSISKSRRFIIYQKYRGKKNYARLTFFTSKNTTLYLQKSKWMWKYPWNMGMTVLAAIVSLTEQWQICCYLADEWDGRDDDKNFVFLLNLDVVREKERRYRQDSQRMGRVTNSNIQLPSAE